MLLGGFRRQTIARDLSTHRKHRFRRQGGGERDDLFAYPSTRKRFAENFGEVALLRPIDRLAGFQIEGFIACHFSIVFRCGWPCLGRQRVNDYGAVFDCLASLAL